MITLESNTLKTLINGSINIKSMKPESRKWSITACRNKKLNQKKDKKTNLNGSNVEIDTHILFKGT